MNEPTKRVFAKGTFGGTRAGETLSRILSEKQDRKLISFIGKKISEFERNIKPLQDIKKITTRQQMISLYTKWFFSTNIEPSELEPKLKSYLICHLSSISKKYMKEAYRELKLQREQTNKHFWKNL